VKYPAQRTLLATLIATGLGLSLDAGSAWAADAAPTTADAPNSDTDAPQRIVVTGSNVPTTRDAVAVSVVEISAEKISNSGVSPNVLELLRKAMPEFEGRGNTGASNANNTNQNTAGGAQVQLKNLDTLILVNGRRVAISAIAGIGGKAFVNASQIPASAIERIEIISDG